MQTWSLQENPAEDAKHASLSVLRVTVMAAHLYLPELLRKYPGHYSPFHIELGFCHD